MILLEKGMFSINKKKKKLKKVKDILKKNYPEFNFYNKDKIFDEILYIFLSWRTPISKAESIYQRVKTDYKDLNELFNLSENDWFKRLESSGKAKDKSRTIVKLLKKIKEDFGCIENVEKLSQKSNDEVYQYLVSLPGIKDKSAFCIMLYTMKRAVFPADAHCLRVSQRLGVIQGTNEKKQDRIRGQRELNDLLKGNYSLCYDLHITMLQHGKKICKRKPLCEQCPISHLCDYYEDRMKNDN